MVEKISKTAKIEVGNREKQSFSGTLRWWDASLVGRFAGGTAGAWLGLGQLRNNFLGWVYGL